MKESHVGLRDPNSIRGLNLMGTLNFHAGDSCNAVECIVNLLIMWRSFKFKFSV